MHPDAPDHRVSHETIYAAMIEALRQKKPTWGRRRTTLAGSSMVPEALRFIHCPGEIEARIVPGHREGDMIKGALEGFCRQMKRLPREMRKSKTYDRGSES